MDCKKVDFDSLREAKKEQRKLTSKTQKVRGKKKS